MSRPASWRQSPSLRSDVTFLSGPPLRSSVGWSGRDASDIIE
jgi:hypothetical protein